MSGFLSAAKTDWPITNATIIRMVFCTPTPYAPHHTPANPNFRHNKSGMNLKLFVDIYNRKLVKSVTSDFPVSLPTIFREDWIDLEVTLLEPTGTITSPVSVVDVSSLSIKVARFLNHLETGIQKKVVRGKQRRNSATLSPVCFQCSLELCSTERN